LTDENSNSITIDYEPTHALPTITGATFAGAPTITILQVSVIAGW
jgi:hypothetical protein